MNTQLIDVVEPRQVSGVYEPYALLDQVSPDELIAMLRRQQRIYRDASDWDCFQAVLAGEVQSVRLQKCQPRFNKVTQGYLSATEGARMTNSHTSNEDGILRYLAIGTGNTEATETDTQLLRETFRAAPYIKANTNIGPKFVLVLPFASPNITTATTIAAGSWTTTQFNVASATGFAIGDAIRVATTPATSETRITNISGNTITVDSNEPLLSIPISGQAVNLLIGEVGAFGNQAASGSANTGTLYSRARLRLLKNSFVAYFIQFTYLRTVV